MCYKIEVTYNMVGVRPEKYQIAGHDEYNKVCKDMHFVWIVDQSFVDDAKDVWPAHEHNQVLGWRCLTDAYAHGWTYVKCSIIQIYVKTMNGDIVWSFDY